MCTLPSFSEIALLHSDLVLLDNNIFVLDSDLSQLCCDNATLHDRLCWCSISNCRPILTVVCAHTRYIKYTIVHWVNIVSLWSLSTQNLFFSILLSMWVFSFMLWQLCIFPFCFSTFTLIFITFCMPH